MKNRTGFRISRPLRSGVVATAALAAAAVSLGLAGCNIATPVALAVAGPGKVKREYELDPSKKTVVLVDDPQNRVASRRLRAAIAESAQTALMRKKRVLEENMIDGRSAIGASTLGTDEEPITVTEIGEMLGADVIIWAVMGEFRLSPDGVRLAPSALMSVSVVDVNRRQQLWPGAPEGYPLSVTTPVRPNFAGDSRRDMIIELQRELAERSGLALAQLFYTVEIPQSVRR